MTTRSFSATNLPHPRYSLELGKLSIRPKEQREQQRQQKQARDNGVSVGGVVGGGDDDDVNLPSTCLPRFSQLAQVIEVKKPGFTLPGRVSSNIKDFLGSYCVIENARPELFVRRDFISKFVDKGTIHISHLSDHHQGTTVGQATTTTAAASALDEETRRAAACGAMMVAGYKLSTRNGNVMTITMNAKQYHRFGLVAKKVISLSTPGPRRKSKRSSKGDDDLYLVELDLRDERIKRNNKYQDRLVNALRRLAPINKVYFRFIPDKSKLHESSAPATIVSPETANELSLEFFNHVIDEYALDGCQPVPLTSCTIGQQKVETNWVNYSQLHPELNLAQLAGRLDYLMGKRENANIACPDELEVEKSEMALAQVIEIIDWLGYQALKLDCDSLSEVFGWNDTASKTTKLDRVDVSCTQIIGNVDCKQVQENLTNLFRLPSDDDVESNDLLLRALILYDGKHRDRFELQLCNTGLDAYGPSICGGDEVAGSGTMSDNSINSGVVYLQDLSNGHDAAQEITVIGMSKVGC